MSDAGAGHPRIALEGPALDHLELVLSGLIAPIDGYRLPGVLPDGWPFESSLRLAIAEPTRNDVMILTDPDGTPLARLRIAETMQDDEGSIFVAGTPVKLKSAEHPPARSIRLDRSDDLSGTAVAIFGRPPAPAQIARVVVAARGRPIILLAVTWNATHGDYSIGATIDELSRCAVEIPGSEVRHVALASTVPSVEYADVLERVLSVLGSQDPIDPSAEGPVTARPPGAESTLGSVILLTGLSGSGKSTVARALSERLASTTTTRTVLLDGDDVRRVLSGGLGFSMADRESNLRRIGWVAARIASVGGTAICAPIAPFASTRAEMRSMAEESGRFILIHVATPLEVCEQRDRKGLYARARAGQIPDFTGIGSPYEVPDDADLVVGRTDESTETIVERILEVIDRSS